VASNPELLENYANDTAARLHGTPPK
jgi:hypothetical protein